MADGEPATAADVPAEGPGQPLEETGDPTAGAPDDEEMPLDEHIREMIHRLGIILLVMALISGVAFLFADRLINFLWYSFLPGTFAQCPTETPTADIACPHLYHPLALLLARLKVASLVGFVLALPVFVYETYLFMRPGLFSRERRYYLASVPTSLVLAGIGLVFAYLLVLPVLFFYFTGYTSSAANVAFGLTETFNLIVTMLGFFALVFQIPLFVMLAVMMGVTTRRWLADRRIYFWGGFLTIAFIFSPDPTGMAPFLVAATMIGLFEGTLLVLRWTDRDSLAPDPDAWAAARPYVWPLAAVAGYVVSTAPVPTNLYSRLPVAFTDGLAQLGVAGATPVVVGGSILLTFEAVAWLARRTEASVRTRRVLARARLPVWVGASVVGYLVSPSPVALQVARDVDLAATTAVALALGLVVVYEATIAVSRYVRRE